MIKLVDASTRALLGTVTEDQLAQLIHALEEESDEDKDYYIDRATVEFLVSRSVDAAVIDLLRGALGDREEMDIRWERA